MSESDAEITDPVSIEEFDELPMKLGMKRDEKMIGYEKRSGGFAGDAGRKDMKIRKGR